MIDIILPCYRCHETIADTIRSIRDQSYTDWNLIIIIDEHDSSLYELLHQLCEGVISKKIIMLDRNYGVAHARNIGLSHSSARYIAFIDADDIWQSNKLEHQLSILEMNVHISVCGTGYDRFTLNPKITKTQISEQNFKVIPSYHLRFYNPFCFSSLVMRREITVGVRMEKVVHEDYDFLIRLCNNNSVCMCLIPDKLVNYRLSPNSLSGTTFNSAISSLRIRKKNYGTIFASLTIPFYIIAVLIKRYVS